MTTFTAERTVPAKIPKIVVYLPEDLKDDLTALAKAEDRPLSNMVRVIIDEAVAKAKEEGRIPKTQPNKADKKEKD